MWRLPFLECVRALPWCRAGRRRMENAFGFGDELLLLAVGVCARLWGEALRPTAISCSRSGAFHAPLHSTILHPHLIHSPPFLPHSSTQPPQPPQEAMFSRLAFSASSLLARPAASSTLLSTSLRAFSSTTPTVHQGTVRAFDARRVRASTHQGAWGEGWGGGCVQGLDGCSHGNFSILRLSPTQSMPHHPPTHPTHPTPTPHTGLRLHHTRGRLGRRVHPPDPDPAGGLPFPPGTLGGMGWDGCISRMHRMGAFAPSHL